MNSSSSMKWIVKVERFLGGLKLAVTLIVLLSLAMTIGTFLESYNGVDYANRVVYKSWPFMILQGMIFLSIYTATVIRLPFKKRLSGFYVLHSGLILIGAGSLVTYLVGIDGNITLYPKGQTREIILNDDVLTISFEKSGKKLSYDLPFTAFQTDLGARYENIQLKDFIPFANKKLVWPLSPVSSASTQYRIANENVAETLTLSLNPRAIEFESSAKLGPLSVHHLPQGLGYCFNQVGPSKAILWDSKNRTCFTPESKGVKLQKTESGKSFLALPFEGKVLTFFPQISPWPLDTKLNPDTDGRLRVFGLDIFEKSPHLFTFGHSIAYHSDGEWFYEKFPGDTKVLALPWMGFELELLRHESQKYPSYLPVYTRPVHNAGELIEGNHKAVLIEVEGQQYWVTDDKMLNLRLNGEKVSFSLEKKTFVLPFEFSLEKFHMDTDPGTNNPASYESYVRIFSQEGISKHKVFMNNPLKKDGLTFYQASYFKTQQGQFGSVLSANFDPGRPIKYGGSLLLVGGSIAHFMLNRKRWKKKASKRENS